MVRIFRMSWLLLVAAMFVSLACGGAGDGSENVAGEGTSVADGGGKGPETQADKGAVTPEKTPMPTQKVFGGKRPVTIKLPIGYDPSKPIPLVVLLHGAGANGELQSAYFGFTLLQEEEKFLMLAPDGKMSKSFGAQFWNATDACCDADNSGVDDLGYIKGLIDEVKSVYKVDEKRVFLVGHSNGGFMSYRIACDASNYISGIAVLAGASFNDKARCKPSQKVNILHMHGTKDPTIQYNGGLVPRLRKPQPGAVKSVDMWAEYNGCTGGREATGKKLDIITDLEGAETSVQAVEGCPEGGSVELWIIQDGKHIPTVAPNFAKEVWNWLNKKVAK